MILASDLPSKISLKVESHGYTLLKYKMSSTLLPISLDIKSQSHRRSSNDLYSIHYILTKYVKSDIEKQMPTTEIKVIDIMPDSLVFKLTNLVQKKVPVKVDVEYDLERQFMISDTIFTIPDSVSITGAANLVDTINYVMTKDVKLDKLSKTTKRNTGLKNIKGIDIKRNRVVLVIPVEQFTEHKVKVPIMPKNVPDTMELKLFPKEVELKFLVGLSNFDYVKPNQFIVTVDYNDVDSLIGNKIKVTTEITPTFINQVRNSHPSVEFLIERRL